MSDKLEMKRNIPVDEAQALLNGAGKHHSVESLYIQKCHTEINGLLRTSNKRYKKMGHSNS